MCFDAKFPIQTHRRFHIERLTRFFNPNEMTELIKKGEITREGAIKGIKYDLNIGIKRADEWVDSVGIHYTLTDKVDEFYILEVLKDPLISNFLGHYETLIKSEFPLKICLRPIVDIHKYEYRTTFFPSRIKPIEDFGELSLSKIEFDVEKSPLGLDKISFGLCSKHLHFELRVIINTNNLSNLDKLFRKQFDILNVFIRIR